MHVLRQERKIYSMNHKKKRKISSKYNNPIIKMSSNIKDINVDDNNINNINWAIIDPLLGRVPDDNIEIFFGVNADIIRMRREFLHILPYGHFEWNILDPLINMGNDVEISKLFNGSLSIYDIATRRNYLERKNKI